MASVPDGDDDEDVEDGVAVAEHVEHAGRAEALGQAEGEDRRTDRQPQEALHRGGGVRER